MFWLDQLLLPLLVTAPAGGAIFVSLVPNFDMPSVRQIVTTLLALWLLVLARCGLLLFTHGSPIEFGLGNALWFLHEGSTVLSMNRHQFLLLLALWFAVFSVFYLDRTSVEKGNLAFSIVVLLLVSFSTLAMLCQSLLAMLVASHIALLLTLHLVSHHAGPYKGSAALQCALFFLCTDVFSFFALLAPPDLFLNKSKLIWLLIVLLPAFSRLLTPFFAPFSRALFANCPTQVMILFIGSLVPVGAALLVGIRLHVNQSELWLDAGPFVDGLVLLSGLLTTLWAVGEKSFRQSSVSLFVFSNLVFIAALLKSNGENCIIEACTLIFSGVLCLSFSLSAANLIVQESDNPGFSASVKRLWFAGIVLFYGIPYVGIGTSLWSLLGDLFKTHSWGVVYVASWFLILMIYYTSLTQKMRPHTSASMLPLVPDTQEAGIQTQRAWIYLMVIAFACALVPQYYAPRGL